MSATATNIIEPALAGPITDTLLEKAIVAARAAQAGRMTEDDGNFLLLTAAPIMEECLQWRRRMGLIQDLASPENVVMFPGTGT